MQQCNLYRTLLTTITPLIQDQQYKKFAQFLSNEKKSKYRKCREKKSGKYRRRNYAVNVILIAETLHR